MTADALQPPRLSDAMFEAGYWPEERHIARPKVFPGGNFTPIRDDILRTYHEVSAQPASDLVPVQDDSMIPRIQKTEGILKIIYDEYYRVEVRGPLKIAALSPKFSGSYVDAEAFESVSAAMTSEPFFCGNNVGVKRVRKDGPWTIKEFVVREAGYVVARPNKGWFAGYVARDMTSKPDSFRVPFSTLRFNTIEAYGFRIGDIVPQNPSDIVSAGRLWTRHKISAAWFIERL